MRNAQVVRYEMRFFFCKVLLSCVQSSCNELASEKEEKASPTSHARTYAAKPTCWIANGIGSDCLLKRRGRNALRKFAEGPA